MQSTQLTRGLVYHGHLRCRIVPVQRGQGLLQGYSIMDIFLNLAPMLWLSCRPPGNETQRARNGDTVSAQDAEITVDSEKRRGNEAHNPFAQFRSKRFYQVGRPIFSPHDSNTPIPFLLDDLPRLPRATKGFIAQQRHERG